MGELISQIGATAGEVAKDIPQIAGDYAKQRFPLAAGLAGQVFGGDGQAAQNPDMGGQFSQGGQTQGNAFGALPGAQGSSLFNPNSLTARGPSSGGGLATLVKLFAGGGGG